MTHADQLRAAKALIDKPEKWTKGAFARGKSGRPVDTDGKYATCFCALGAKWQARVSNASWRYITYALPASASANAAFFNDHPDTTHADIMALFDRAIALAEKEAVA